MVLFCWQGCDKDPGGFKKKWYGTMKECQCEVSSTWSVCGKGRAEVFTHRHLSQDKKEEISQLDYIIVPMGRNDEIYIHNARKTLGNLGPLSNLRPKYKKRHTKVFQKRIKKWTGWEPTNRRSIIDFFSKRK